MGILGPSTQPDDTSALVDVVVDDVDSPPQAATTSSTRKAAAKDVLAIEPGYREAWGWESDEAAEENEVVVKEVVLGPTSQLVLHQLVAGVSRTVHPLFVYPKHG